jgi:hypothetical protein
VRLTDLLHAQVTDSLGAVVGEVIDVRLVQDGPLLPGWGAALRLEGLIISRHRVGSTLGYDRSSVRGPWLVAAIVRRLHRDDRYAPWAVVESHGAGAVRLSVSREQLEAPPPLPGV